MGPLSGFWTSIMWFPSGWTATICCLYTIYTVAFCGPLRQASLPLPLSDWMIGDWHPPTASPRLSAWFRHFLSLTILCCSQTSGFDRILHGYLLLSWLPHAMRKKSFRLPRHFFGTEMCQKYVGFTLLDSYETKPFGRRFRMNCTFCGQ